MSSGWQSSEDACRAREIAVMNNVFDTVSGIARPLARLARGERGVTGLETAIILIAFVVVASVFAFTVLSTGIFSAERGRETVFAGLKQASGSIALKGAVIAKGVPDVALSDAETPWGNMPDVTATVDTTSRKQGSGSALIQVADAFATGLVAYEFLSPPVDMSRTDSVQVWLKSDLPTSAGDLQLVLSESPTCIGTVETIDMPAMAADDWTFTTLGITDAFDRDAITCLGLIVATDQGAQVLNLDDIYGPGQITDLVITLSNAVEGEPVDLTEPSDSDGDGIADAENRRHRLIITYTDSRQVHNDLFWTKAFVGVSDGDDLMEVGEKVEITINMEALEQDQPLIESQAFRIELKPAESAVLPLDKRTPGQIDPVMSLF